jgi:osmotically-inducible protein OsmY
VLREQVIKLEYKLKKTTNINATALKIALHNYLALDSKFVKIVVLGSNMILKGTVDSWYQKRLAERIAWNTSGVIGINNELLIEEG